MSHDSVSLVQGVQALMRSAVHPLLQSVTDSIEAIIITLHQEDFSGSVVSLPASLHQQQLSTYNVSVFVPATGIRLIFIDCS